MLRFTRSERHRAGMLPLLDPGSAVACRQGRSVFSAVAFGCKDACRSDVVRSDLCEQLDLLRFP